ncbi:hypothetical protein FPOAC1_010527 [Fusarium poae]|uniref:hypothetical protein n=1 Tax=Fusarium poae TaxID=36050 RepID=UPI001CE9E975|nr:hypothetical protein FPOAC1_010527 [Fusarium poae]KAG8665726.1 hypothetical protein FPOAC1_010527 [Fusarium poae]
MSPVDTPSSLPQMTNASSNLESQAASTDEQTENEEVRQDPESQENAEYGRGKLLELAAWKDQDPTHILFRRHVENGSLCVDLEANYLEKDATVLRNKVESDDEDLEECHQRFMARLDQFGYQFSKIMELDEPSGVFLNNSLYLAREKWGEEKGIHLRAKNEDWASLYKTDKPDQWICYLLHHPLSLRIMRDMNLVSNEGGITITFISGRYARFAIVGLFNCFVCIFVSAPVAILTLSTMTPMGTIVTYLSFVLCPRKRRMMERTFVWHNSAGSFGTSLLENWRTPVQQQKIEVRNF